MEARIKISCRTALPIKIDVEHSNGSASLSKLNQEGFYIIVKEEDGETVILIPTLGIKIIKGVDEFNQPCFVAVEI